MLPSLSQTVCAYASVWWVVGKMLSGVCRTGEQWVGRRKGSAPPSEWDEGRRSASAAARAGSRARPDRAGWPVACPGTAQRGLESHYSF